MPTLSRSRSSARPQGAGTSSWTASRSTSAPTGTRRSAATTSSWARPDEPRRGPRAIRQRRRPSSTRSSTGARSTRPAAPTTGIATTSSPSPARCPRDLAVAELKPFHVQQWLDANPGWKTGKRGAIIAVQRAFNWAARMGLHRAEPAPPRREAARPGGGTSSSPPSEFDEILGLVKDQEFRDLLDRLLGDRLPAAGGPLRRGPSRRPGRTAAGSSRRGVQGQEAQRVVYLTDAALEITRRRDGRAPAGPLFRNTDGVPWTPSPSTADSRRLRVALGTKQLDALGLVPPKLKRLKKAQREDRGGQDAPHRGRFPEASRHRRVGQEAWAEVLPLHLPPLLVHPCPRAWRWMR